MDEEFAKRARRWRISTDELRRAVRDADAGLVAARLGGGLLKMRLARRGGGKSGGFRTVLAFRPDDRAFFIYLFPKNVSENISDQELDDLKAYGKILLALSDESLGGAIAAGKLQEIL